MNDLERIRRLNAMLLEEMPEYREQAEAFSMEESAQRRLLRSLMNVRLPMPLCDEFLAMQDALLSAEKARRGVVDGCALSEAAAYPRISLWQGDITRLAVDAIVNAGNSALLGRSAALAPQLNERPSAYAAV